MSTDEELTAVVKQWWVLDCYGTAVSVKCGSEENMSALSNLSEIFQDIDSRYGVELALNG